MTEEQFAMLLERLDKIIELYEAAQKPREVTITQQRFDVGSPTHHKVTTARAIPPDGVQVGIIRESNRS